MTSKNSFCDLTQLAGRMKRGAWLPGLIASVLFFSLPVATALSISNFTPRETYLEMGLKAWTWQWLHRWGPGGPGGR